MEYVISLFVILFGLCLGSFLNVCIVRMPKEESIVSPPSHCPVCNERIRWYDNIPVISFIVLLGRCRACRTRISFRYAAVEILTAALVLLLYRVFGLSIHMFAYCVLFSCLIVGSFIDIEYQIIPDSITLGLCAAGLLLSSFFPSLMGTEGFLYGLTGSLTGLLAGGASIYIIGAVGTFLFKKEAMGGGDVKLMAGIGAFLGWKLVLLAFFLAPFFGAGVGLFVKFKYKEEVIPYGPFLALGSVIALLWGDTILEFLFGGYLY